MIHVKRCFSGTLFHRMLQVFTASLVVMPLVVSAHAFYVRGVLGYTWPLKGSQSKIRVIGAPFPDDVYMPEKPKSRPLLGLEFGRNIDLNGNMLQHMSVGLALKVGRIKPKGSITSMDLLRQYDYQGKLSFVSVLGVARVPLWVCADSSAGLSAYLGAGLSRNRLFAYKELKVSNGGRDLRDTSFKDRSRTGFAWAVGMSFHKLLKRDLLGVAGFEYLDAGKISYGNILQGKKEGTVSGPEVKLKLPMVSVGLQYMF